MNHLIKWTSFGLNGRRMNTLMIWIRIRQVQYWMRQITFWTLLKSIFMVKWSTTITYPQRSICSTIYDNITDFEARIYGILCLKHTMLRTVSMILSCSIFSHDTMKLKHRCQSLLRLYHQTMSRNSEMCG